ncbi:MAG: helix-turn-helix domain-containing protein [Firmicutes bacterium]|nr:helix-turn-helix domain-containing protein [Bacillota bacterium]
MINILLAGSDIENIKNFRAHIARGFPDMKTVGAATDGGRDIVPFIRELKPDLIIADVRFFGPNSVRAFQDIHEKFPEVRFILYGAYSDAEYLKSGRGWGAVDFMYRPVKPADLTRCLQTAEAYFKKAELERKNETDLGRRYAGETFRYRDLFLRGLFGGEPGGEREIRASFRYFGMAFGKSFTAALIDIDRFDKIVLTLDEREKHMLGFRIAGIAAEVFGGGPLETVQIGYGRLAALLGAAEDPEKTLALWEDLKDRIREKAKVSVTIGVGRSYASPADICVSYREAEGALRHRFRLGGDCVIPIGFAEPDNIVSYRYPFQRENELTRCAAAGDFERCAALLAEIFGALEACGPLPERFCSKMATAMSISISLRLSEQNLGLREPFTGFFPSREALELDAPASARAYLETALEKLCAAIIRRRGEIDRRLTDLAKDYIRERYFETFSLPRLALAVGSTPEHIQKLFLGLEGQTLFDFAVKTRLDEAKRLIRETGESDEAVAVKVGYGDVRHFRSLFRQYEGTDTADYRARYAAPGATGKR